MPNTNISARFLLAPLYLVLLILLSGHTVAVPQSEAQDADDEQSIDEIVVVAHKVERSVRDIAANVTVVSREDSSADLSASVADVFRYSPGIDYEASGSRFDTEGINIRGIGGNRVAMLVDGVPLSDQFDVGSFSNATRDFINAGLVERIEVLHGPASALYGSSAIGGVVAVRTPDPSNLIRNGNAGGDATMYWRGADESAHGTGMVAFGESSISVLIGGSLRSGHQTESAAVDRNLDMRNYERQSALFKVVKDTDAGQTWRLGVMHQASDVTSNLNSMLGTGRYRSTSALQGDDEYTLDLINLEYEFGSPEAWIDSGVVRAYYETAEISQQTLDERGLSSSPVSIDRYFNFDQQIQGAEVNLQKNLNSRNTTHKLGFGVEYRERETTEYRDGLSTSMLVGTSTNVILGEVFPLRDFPVGESAEWGAYFEDVMSVGNWSLIGAVRLDRYELSPSSDPMYAEDYPFAEIVALEESDVAPKLGVIYRLNPDTDLFVQYSHGFRAPPYEDANIGLEIPVFNYRAIPNPDLRSESSNGFDVGVRWQGVEKGARLSVFRTRYTDFIESKVRLGIDPVSGRTLFQSQNLKKTVIEGVEAGGYINLQSAIGDFRFDGALYLAKGENRRNGQAMKSGSPFGADRKRNLQSSSSMTRHVS